MDNRNTLIALGLYLGLAVVVGLALVSAFWLYQPALTYPERTAEHLANRWPGDRQSQLARVPETPLVETSLGPDRSRVLELMLADKSEQLRAALDQVKEGEEAYADLRRQFDQLLSSAVELLVDEPARSGSATMNASTTGGPPPVNETAEEARVRLQNELDKAEIVQQGLIDEVDRLRREVTRVMDDSMAIQMSADQEIRALLNNELVVQSAATDTLARVGEAAVPSIIDSLHSELPEVRRWAARVLGQMGSQADSAKLALTEALLDRDDQVRVAARAALDAIEREMP